METWIIKTIFQDIKGKQLAIIFSATILFKNTKKCETACRFATVFWGAVSIKLIGKSKPPHGGKFENHHSWNGGQVGRRRHLCRHTGEIKLLCLCRTP